MLRGGSLQSVHLFRGKQLALLKVWSKGKKAMGQGFQSLEIYLRFWKNHRKLFLQFCMASINVIKNNLRLVGVKVFWLGAKNLDNKIYFSVAVKLATFKFEESQSLNFLMFSNSTMLSKSLHCGMLDCIWNVKYAMQWLLCFKGNPIWNVFGLSFETQ